MRDRGIRSPWRAAALLALLPSLAAAQAPPPTDTLELGRAIDAVLADDPRLQAANARLGQAEAARGVAAAARRPSVSASALVVQYAEPMIVAPLHALDLANLPVFDATLIQGRVLASHTVYDGGATGARNRAAQALEAAARSNVEDARAAVLEDLAESWLSVLGARDVLAAQRERLLDLEAERERATRMFDEGAAPRLVQLRAEAELSAAGAAAEGALARLGLAESMLARRIGSTPEAVAGSALAELPSPRPDALAETPGDPGPAALAAARERVAAATARVDEASAARRPRLAATSALEEFGAASSSFSTEWHAGLQVDYPIFTGGARGRAIELAQAERRETQAQLAELERSLLEAQEAARASRTEALARAASLADAVTSLEELVRIEQLALSEGAGVQRDFLQAAADLAEARAGLAEARRAAVFAEVRLARATGRLTPEWMRTLAEAGR